jgi:hypothetical protein
MAITSLDGALAGMQPPWAYTKATSTTLVAGRPFSFWYTPGFPSTGAVSTGANPNGSNLTSTGGLVAGMIPRADPSTSLNSYLARFSAMASQPGTLILADRLWSNGVAATVTSQAISQPTLPARDNNGATTGQGVLIGLEISSSTSTNAPTITLTYTGTSGSTTRSATNIDATAASASQGAFYRIGLASGDTGVASANTLALSATWTAGSYTLVAYRVLAQLELAGTLVPNAVDAITAGFPKLYAGTVPFLIWVPSTTTATALSGQYIETQG